MHLGVGLMLSQTRVKSKTPVEIEVIELGTEPHFLIGRLVEIDAL
jgi:hypothetical protein